MLRAIAITALLLAATPGVARGASWQWPVSGRVVGSFSLSPDDPYAVGQRRGIAIAAPPGTTVRSACSGRVAFSGPVGRAGPTISVLCGALRATYQGIAGVGVDEGKVVARGEPIATLAQAGVLRLGARRESSARAASYVDPATLLAAQKPPLGPAPTAHRRAPHGPPPEGRTFRPRPVPHVRLHAALTPEPAPSIPAAAWLGLALLIPAALTASSLRPACRSTSRRRSTTSTRRRISGMRTRRSGLTSLPATSASAARTSSS